MLAVEKPNTMKIILWMALLLSSSLLSQAASITLIDAYGGPNPGTACCNGDVIGQLSEFDINRLTINTSGNNVSIHILLNWNNGDTALSPITPGQFPTVNPGDLMITSGANYWAIPVINHNNTAPGAGGLTAGNLYAVTGFLTAFQILNNSCSTCYRPTEDVWGNSTGATLVGAGTRTTSFVTGSEIDISINFIGNAAFLAALESSNTFIHYAAATCGNDILDGTGQGDSTAATPEPVSFALMGAGLIALGVLRHRISVS